MNDVYLLVAAGIDKVQVRMKGFYLKLDLETDETQYAAKRSERMIPE